ncbi:MAG: bifunctional DNA-formamidopyrimidine glycosylase/DNA-(apurinic or apyrimidinic site) lyase [bacterium]|nr:bifunctional DNA-formamidopyrimidine glycosylase/DNA-(apurinic or apyrimidinic site) lyase [bacterium]
MPELPEVQTTVNGLHAKVLNRAFVDVWSDWEKMACLRSQVKKPADFKIFKKELKGKKIVRVWRRAKNVIFELSGGYSLLIHMKMTGHLLVGKWEKVQGEWRSVEPGFMQERINGFLHLIFFLDDGRMIALSDMRKFAKVELWKTDELFNGKEFLAWGPEPLEKSFTLKKFKEALHGKKGKIKQVIMVPQVIAGIGNIYASEALWWARIHPEKSAARLSKKELQALYTAIKKVLAAGIDFGGDSFSDYRNVDGEKGKFEGMKKVYQREKQPCSRCKTPIKRLKLAQRSSFYCPNCQKL